MLKLPTRIIALLLVPCLIMDPAIAAIKGPAKFGPHEDIFSNQALSLASATSLESFSHERREEVIKLLVLRLHDLKLLDFDHEAERMEYVWRFENVYENLAVAAELLITRFQEVASLFDWEIGSVQLYLVGGRLIGKPLRVSSDLDLIFAVENNQYPDDILEDGKPISFYNKLVGASRKLCAELNISDLFHIHYPTKAPFKNRTPTLLLASRPSSLDRVSAAPPGPYVFKDFDELHRGKVVAPDLPRDPERVVYRGMNLTLEEIETILKRGMEVARSSEFHPGQIWVTAKPIIGIGSARQRGAGGPQKNFVIALFQIDRTKVVLPEGIDFIASTLQDIPKDGILGVWTLNPDGTLRKYTSLSSAAPSAAQNRTLLAGYFARMAQFWNDPDDPPRRITRGQYYRQEDDGSLVPIKDKIGSSRLPPANERGEPPRLGQIEMGYHSVEFVNVVEEYAYARSRTPRGPHFVIGSPNYCYCVAVMINGIDAQGRRRIIHWHDEPTNLIDPLLKSHRIYLLKRIPELIHGLKHVQIVILPDGYVEGAIDADEFKRMLNVEEVMVLTRDEEAYLAAFAADQGVGVFLEHKEEIEHMPFEDLTMKHFENSPYFQTWSWDEVKTSKMSLLAMANSRTPGPFDESVIDERNGRLYGIFKLMEETDYIRRKDFLDPQYPDVHKWEKQYAHLSNNQLGEEIRQLSLTEYDPFEMTHVDRSAPGEVWLQQIITDLSHTASAKHMYRRVSENSGDLHSKFAALQDDQASTASGRFNKYVPILEIYSRAQALLIVIVKRSMSASLTSPSDDHFKYEGRNSTGGAA